MAKHKTSVGHREPSFEDHETQGQQGPENQHGPNYWNDTPSDWRRGAGFRGGEKPTFDYGNSWRRRDGGLDRESGSDYRPNKIYED